MTVAASIPDPQAAWVRSTMTEAKIQALVNRGLLQPKEEVEWRATAGEQFLSEDVKEQVVFASFFERGFNLPVGDFFCGLLYYYQLELVHLVANSITVVSTFIHFCEAYLCEEHWQEVGPVGAVMFNLRSGLKAEWIDTDLPEVGGIRNQAFHISKIKECLQLPKFLRERPNSETPRALESIFVFQNPSFDQYASSLAELPNELRITQGVRISVRLIIFFRDETPEANLAHSDNFGLGFAWGISSSLTSNNSKFECDPCFR
jgi:hypothetical protein